MSNVNNPEHYNQGRFECIDVIEDLQLGFHLGNVIKYVWRYQLKGGLEDLEKAEWHLKRKIEKLKNGRKF